MNSRDRRLGMDRSITRRDFLNGVGIAVGAAMLPGCSRNDEPAAAIASYYPPASTGLRGSHPGSFEVAHALVQGQQWPANPTGEDYDLVIVGAGISGLSAAHIYRRDIDSAARILILDNHDDFGGHAKRNEFSVDGRMFLGFGGTMNITAPGTYPEVSREVLRDLGIDAQSYSKYAHDDHFSSFGMQSGTFFDKETFGEDFLAVGPDRTAMLEGAPLSESAKQQLTRLFADDLDYLEGMTTSERRDVLESLSWKDYLATHAAMGSEALTFIQKYPHGVWAIGADAFPAWLAWLEGYPGFAGMDIGYDVDDTDGGRSFFYPDGNASIARMLARKLVPSAAPGNTMEDIVTARFDYAKLDQPDNSTRIRLNSTVVDLRHRNGDLDANVDVTYVTGDDAATVSAGKVVWAGYHAILPFVCPDIPEDQASAQRNSVRSPLVYTNVLIRNWRSFAKLGISGASCPGSFFSGVRINRPTSIGDYRYSETPDEPVVLFLLHIPVAPGLPAADQFRAGRQQLLETPFETFERNVRDQLGRILGPGGFDPARDIEAITVNRWPHGYAFSVDGASGDVAWWPEFWRHESRPWVEARQTIGNIAIANTDAASNAMTESAIEEAHRAVHSL